MSTYSTPSADMFRLHHVRPRFKNDVESVLAYMASEIAKLPKAESKVFADQLERAIRAYPGNASKDDKTISNWRTEISALFGLVVPDKEADVVRPGEMAVLLAENQDLIQFFRYFLLKFQYPGGHVKSHDVLEMVRNGVRFKPAKFIACLLLEGEKLDTGKRFGISKAELTHCVFNDLRFTRGDKTPAQALELIIGNRQSGVEYDTRGDIIRYAGDILDYMVLADLLDQMPDNKFYLKRTNREAIEVIARDDSWFTGYDKLYGKKEDEVLPSECTAIQDDWFAYVNRDLDPKLFEADITQFIEEEAKQTQSEFLWDVIARIRAASDQGGKAKTNDIGNAGEALVLQHEKNRVKSLGLESLLTHVKQIPSHFAVGYDIQSVEADTTRRYIEVKTTISRNKIAINRFHLTPSEWTAAESHQERYFVYRLMISGDDINLTLIRNPVGKYKAGDLNMLPIGGADVLYTEKSGTPEKLLV